MKERNRQIRRRKRRIRVVLLFFFSSRRRHTRYWRDWSSDVCSSDLPNRAGNSRQLPGSKERSAYLGTEDRGVQVREQHTLRSDDGGERVRGLRAGVR